MKSIILSLVVLICPTLAHAGNVHCGHLPVRGHNNGYVDYHQQHQKLVLFASVGYSTQIEAEVTRAQKPLVAELQAVRAENANILQTLNALRTEQKASFAKIFRFKGQGTVTFEGEGGGDTDPTPQPVPPGPQPQPSADRGPVLTDGVKALLTNNCSVCHNDTKEKAFTLDANGTLEANRSVEIWARVLSAKPGVMMPPAGSTEEMRNVVNDWYANASQRSLESEILSRKGK